jgi:hypothetical protein
VISTIAARSPLRGPQRLHDLRLHGDVERGGRLVGDDHVRVVGHRDGDDHPLAHAAGQLVREVVQPLARVGDATSSSSSTARSRACARLTSWCASTASATGSQSL